LKIVFKQLNLIISGFSRPKILCYQTNLLATKGFFFDVLCSDRNSVSAWQEIKFRDNVFVCADGFKSGKLQLRLW